MKDRIGKQRWDNLPLKNPTQTRYNRFRTGPQGEFKSGFTDAIEGFEKAMRVKKTLYEKYLGEL